MITFSLAQALKDAGLVWVSKVNDYFMIPDRELDDRIFVLSDMLSSLELLRGWPVVTFHGAMEWALDYVLTSETVWLPTEGQLREELVKLLRAQGEPSLQLTLSEGGYICRVGVDDDRHEFGAETGIDAYGRALLYFLQAQSEGNEN